MEIKELIKNTPHSEIIKEIIELYSERIEENKISHVNSYSKEIALLDRIITQYFFTLSLHRQSHHLRSKAE